MRFVPPDKLFTNSETGFAKTPETYNSMRGIDGMSDKKTAALRRRPNQTKSETTDARRP
jgi:hypothetical protein